MKTLLTITCMTVMAATVAMGQKTMASDTSSAGACSEATGKIVEFTAGSAIVLNTGANQPVQYKLSKGVTYMNARGKVVKAGKMKKDRKVRVHYEKEGTDMVVDKINVVKD